ncbi:MAG: hypothetical protein Q6367_007725, partial [Candidatus Freyarchaeota archaeon]
MALAPAITRCPLCENKLHVRKTAFRPLKGKSAVFKVTVKELHLRQPTLQTVQGPSQTQRAGVPLSPHMTYGTSVVFF